MIFLSFEYNFLKLIINNCYIFAIFEFKCISRYFRMRRHHDENRKMMKSFYYFLDKWGIVISQKSINNGDSVIHRYKFKCFGFSDTSKSINNNSIFIPKLLKFFCNSRNGRCCNTYKLSLFVILSSWWLILLMIFQIIIEYSISVRIVETD